MPVRYGGHQGIRAMPLRHIFVATAMTRVFGFVALSNETFRLDPVFGNEMVLQRAPSQASVYGFRPSLFTGILVTVADSATGSVVSSTEAVLDSYRASLDGGILEAGTGSSSGAAGNDLDEWVMEMPTWTALLPATMEGGDYVITAACTGGCGSARPIVLEGVTFGDVWQCTGFVSSWVGRHSMPTCLHPPHPTPPPPSPPSRAV